MIELLGQSFVSSAVTAGLDKFMSIFRKKSSTAFSEGQGRHPRAYTSTRGILIRKQDLDVAGAMPNDLSNAFYFQFNPAVVNDVKDTLYEVRGYAGLSYNDYIWGGGGERLVTFQLFLDDTPQTHTSNFRPTEFGSKKALRLDEEAISEGEFKYKRGSAFSNKRINERGVLPKTEFIQSFLYPEIAQDAQTPKFAEGGVISDTQFKPPATVVFALGPIYLEGIIKSAPITYSLFDVDLTPIRATIDIELAVHEFVQANRLITYETVF